MTSLSFPNARLTIEDAIETFADIDAQTRNWIMTMADPSNAYPSFQDAVHWLFDDSGLGDGVNTCVGYMLYDDREAIRLDALMTLISGLIEKYGSNLPSLSYLKSPEWPSIVASAGACLNEFRQNDELHNVLLSDK